MEVVLVECEHKKSKSVVSKSAFKFGERHVITVGSILQDSLPNNETLRFFVTRNRNGELLRSEAVISATFECAAAADCVHEIFGEWSIDSYENSNSAKRALCLCVVLELGFEVTSDVVNELRIFGGKVMGFESALCKGREILIESVPFGNKNFISNQSCGIVSNVLGRDNCFILSDCPTVPGSEGGPVYLKGEGYKSQIPLGIVVSSLSWWRGEWIGLTLCINFFTLLNEIVSSRMEIENFSKMATFSPTTLFVEEKSLMQVTCRGQWGTAILLSNNQGILLTNSHVVSKGHKIELRWRDKKFHGEILYQTPDHSPCDLAVLKTDSENCKLMESFKFADKPASRGEVVYAAGYSLFPQKLKIEATLTRGVISHVSPTMLKTSCCIHPGASGGALFRPNGQLLGVIVSNAKLMETVKVAFPRVNMCIPIAAVVGIIEKFLKNLDVSVLKELESLDRGLWKDWIVLNAKL